MFSTRFLAYLILLDVFAKALSLYILPELLKVDRRNSTLIYECNNPKNCLNITIDNNSKSDQFHYKLFGNRIGVFSNSNTNLELLSLIITYGRVCNAYNWVVNIPNSFQIEDCISLGSSVWYGGPLPCKYSLSSGFDFGNKFKMQSYKIDSCSTVNKMFTWTSKPIWFNSDGWTVSITSAINRPFEISFNAASNFSSEPAHSLCIRPTSRWNSSYPGSLKSVLRYQVCKYDNVSAAWSAEYASAAAPLETNPMMTQDDYLSSVWRADSILHQSGTISIISYDGGMLSYLIRFPYDALC